MYVLWDDAWFQYEILGEHFHSALSADSTKKIVRKWAIYIYIMLDYFSWRVISLYYIIVCAFKHWGTSCCALLLHCLIKSYDSRTNPDVSGPSQVCASDGRSHANYAAMVVDGCRRNKTVEVSYKGYCKSTCLLPSLPSVHAWLCLLCADVYVCLYTALKLLSSK